MAKNPSFAELFAMSQRSGKKTPVCSTKYYYTQRGIYLPRCAPPIPLENSDTNYLPPKTDTMSKPKHIEEIAADYAEQHWTTTRRSIALSRKFPGAFVRYRRAAKDGPNSVFAVLFIFKPGDTKGRSEIWPFASIERLGEQVTDAEVAEWLTRYTEELE